MSGEGRAMSQIFSPSSASLCLAQIRRESCFLCEWSASEARELPPYPWKQFGMKNKVDASTVRCLSGDKGHTHHQSDPSSNPHQHTHTHTHVHTCTPSPHYCQRVGKNLQLYEWKVLRSSLKSPLRIIGSILTKSPKEGINAYI